MHGPPTPRAMMSLGSGRATQLSAGPRILVVTGLASEATVAAGPGIATCVGGARSEALRSRLQAIDSRGLAAVVSFGVAGALDPRLAVGSVVLATEVTDLARSRVADEGMRTAWSVLLAKAGQPFSEASVVGVDRPAMDVAAKSALRIATGAAIVDMESHIAASWAEERGLRFGAIRVVSDSALRTLPPLAATAMRPDGSVAVGHVLARLVRSPGQIPALIATGRDAAVAFRALGRVRGLLGHLVGLDL